MLECDGVNEECDELRPDADVARGLKVKSYLAPKNFVPTTKVESNYLFAAINFQEMAVDTFSHKLLVLFIGRNGCVYYRPD